MQELLRYCEQIEMTESAGKTCTEERENKERILKQNMGSRLPISELSQKDGYIVFPLKPFYKLTEGPYHRTSAC